MTEDAGPRPIPASGANHGRRSERAATTTRHGKRKPGVVFRMPELAVAGQAVSQAEIEFFIANGFIVKRGLLDARAVAAALDRAWAHLLGHVPVAEGWSLSRRDPSSWINPRWAPMPPAAESGPHQGRQPIVYSGVTVKLHDLGDADYLLDLLPNNPRVRRVATTLLADDLRPSARTRGVYAIFPTAPVASGEADVDGAALGPHTDQVCQQLNACAYLDHVAPRNGGFTIYPGSHKMLFQAHRTEANWSPLACYRDVVRRVVEEITPWELIGEQGDVIFWHGRSVHSSGIHVGGDVRWAVFADFTRDREVLSADEHKRLGQFEWYKDAKLFRDDPAATGDMWRHWKLGR